MPADDFKVNDPVHVHRDGPSSQSKLEGVVAYLGQVQFADGDDWVGIRLTGSSIGLGKNDGTVQGHKYFDCPAQCGLFVKVSAVHRRQLTRLEELRLRRELATTGGADASSSSSSTRTPARTRTGAPATPSTTGSSSSTARSSRTPAAAGGGTSTTARTPPPTTAAASAAATRLEEIRQRRAQLQQGGTTTTTTTTAAAATTTSTSSTSPLKASTSAAAATSPSSSATGGADEWQRQVQQLKEQLQSQTVQLKQVQGELVTAQTESTTKSRQIEELHHQIASSTSTATPTAPPPASATAAAAKQKEVEDLQHHLEQMEEKLVLVTKTAKATADEWQSKFQKTEVELASSQALVTNLQQELAQRDDAAAALKDQERVVTITAADASSHYKERAKLQAEVASLNRRVEQLEFDKQELEHNVEELALDKEQLEELKESLEDRLEELKLDTETAQMEAEEAKMELEETRVRLEAAEGSAVMATAAAAAKTATATGAASPSSPTAIGSSNTEDDQEAQDLAQNLSIQNARLREALIRLREKTGVEKMDMSRQLRSLEKEAQEAKALATEVEALREMRKELEEQISDLKDMVEQGSAYEVMVEDLSDRVLGLEEELISLQQTVREMEEAADITAEMEEVQADELKALNREMEDRETVIRNLEEAIKMQRKREEDFQRTVSNYRSMMEKLKHEKNALLELQEGGEGEKSDLVTASQKALARAAQLVQDATEMRKREAQAAIDRIDSQVRLHLSERLESMLPSSAAQSEIASIKGELLLSKVVGKASLSLDGIARSFNKTCRARAWEWRSDNSEGKDISPVPPTLVLTDDQKQMAATMIHQSEVAHVAIDVSGDLLWLLSAGQWPDLLSTEASAELGAILGHSMDDLDFVLGNVLNTLKEEGVLSPHQSNIGQFRQTVITTMQTLRSQIEQDGVSLLPVGWKPPALKLFRDASRAKFSSLGCYAAVASVLNAGDATNSGEGAPTTQELVHVLKLLLRKLDQAAAEATKSCLRLSHLDVLDETIVGSLSEAADSWRSAADDLLGNIYNILLSDDGLTPDAVGACESATDEVLKLVSHFASVLRSANLVDTEEQRFHPFSPEVADVWEGVNVLARIIRSKDGDAEDVNFKIRARGIQQNLEDAVEAVPALSKATSKVSSLEKALSLRSKEIAMQNARLSELEKLLAKTNAQPSSRMPSSQMVSSEEMNTMKQENRVLSEAMDVLHRQVEEYENEIRFLNSKTPTKSRSRTPRRTFTADPSALRDHSRSSESLHALDEESMAGAFEAALFRPALQVARQEASKWKNKAMVDTLLNLPPLNVRGHSVEDEQKESDDVDNPLLQLSSALSNYQKEVASTKLVDLNKPSPRLQLHNTLMRKAAASAELDKATAVARQWLEIKGNHPHTFKTDGHPLVGRVKFAGPNPRTIPTQVKAEDLVLLQFHLHAVQ